MPAFVAYPFGDYPVRYFEPEDRLSFSVIASPQSAFASNRVDFSSARILVACEGRQLGVSSMRWDNEGFGIANNLEWRVRGLKRGEECSVDISGVRNAPQEDYRYRFRIVD